MNITQSTSTQNTWDLPTNEPTLDPKGGRSQTDIDKWHSLTPRIYEIAMAEGWSKAETARQLNIPNGTFSQYYSGKYVGRLDNLNDKVEKWLISWDELSAEASKIPESPNFMLTPTGNVVISALKRAQSSAGLVAITIASGLGKTIACNHFRSTRPNVVMVTASPFTKKAYGIMIELAEELGVVQHNPARLPRAVGKRLQKSGGGTLLIVDEAQNLIDEAIDQLRQFKDLYGCGLALIGNDEVYDHLVRNQNGVDYGQLKSRMSRRVRRSKPLPEDVSMLLDAWRIEDPDVRKVLTGIAYKPGTLRQMDETIKLAQILAGELRKPLSAELVEAAWSGRDVEGL